MMIPVVIRIHAIQDSKPAGIFQDLVEPECEKQLDSLKYLNLKLYIISFEFEHVYKHIYAHTPNELISAYPGRVYMSMLILEVV